MERRVSFQRTEALEHKLDFYPSHCYSVTSSYIVSQDVDLMVSCGLIEFSLTKQ